MAMQRARRQTQNDTIPLTMPHATKVTRRAYKAYLPAFTTLDRNGRLLGSD